MKIIGLIAPKEAGKTTTVELMRHELASPYTSIKEFMIAEKLKRVCGRYYSINTEVFNRQELKELPLNYFGRDIKLAPIEAYLIAKAFGFKGTHDDVYKLLIDLDLYFKRLKTPREILQVIGTEILRPLCGDDCHVKQFENTEADIAIVTDIRFQNELDYFKNKYGKDFHPVYIENLEADEGARNATHISEKGILAMKKQCSTVISNPKDSLINHKVRVQSFLLYKGLL